MRDRQHIKIFIFKPKSLFLRKINENDNSSEFLDINDSAGHEIGRSKTFWLASWSCKLYVCEKGCNQLSHKMVLTMMFRY